MIRKATTGNQQGLDAEDIENDILLAFFESLPENLRANMVIDSPEARDATLNYFYTAAKNRAFPSAKNDTKSKWQREAVRIDDDQQSSDHIHALAYKDAFSSIVANQTLFTKNSRFLHAIALKADGYTEDEIAPMLSYADNKTLNRALKSNTARKEIFGLVWPYLSESLCSEVAADYEPWLFGEPADSEAALSRINAHIDSCERCSAAHDRNRTYLRAHSLMLPLPAIAAGAAGGGEGFFTNLWHSISTRFSDTSTAIATQSASSNWQTAKPFAAGAAVIALMGGGAYVATNPGAGDETKPAASSSTKAGPTSLIDELPAPKPEKKKAKKKKRKKATAPAAAPAPVAAPVAPQPVQSTQPPVDDGSAEFLPEQR